MTLILNAVYNLTMLIIYTLILLKIRIVHFKILNFNKSYPDSRYWWWKSIHRAIGYYRTR